MGRLDRWPLHPLPSQLPPAPPVVPKAGDRRPCSCPAGGGATGDCQAVALALWARPLGGPGPRALFYTDSLLLSLSLSLFVTESGGPGAKGILGGGGPALLPKFLSHPGCCFGPAATPSPVVPVEACPALVSPMPSTTGTSHALQSWGRHRGTRMDA